MENDYQITLRIHEEKAREIWGGFKTNGRSKILFLDTF